MPLKLSGSTRGSSATFSCAVGLCLLWFCRPVAVWGDLLPYGADVMDQSTFAMGSMTWNVFFVQGDGSIQAAQESWTAAEIAHAQARVRAAADYWEGLTAGFHTNARLSIDINYVNNAVPVSTGYEPTTDRSEVWVNDVMSSLGYHSPSRLENVRNYNHDMRVANETHWATSVFLLDNTSAGLDSYGYAYLGGPGTIMTYNAAGWGVDNLNLVTAHEMGHIFFAHDEYAGSNRRTTDRAGYLNVENGNASRDANGNIITPPQPNALMRNNGGFSSHIPYAPSDYTLGMIGHRDSDLDGIPDILDTNPLLNGHDTLSDANTGTFVFTGSTQVNPIPNQNPINIGFSNSQNDMTINTISNAWYRLDGGAPVSFSALDGSYDGYTESLQLTLAGLTGNHTIDIYTQNSVDNQSSVLSFQFNSMAAVPEPGSLAVLGLWCGWWWRRRSTRQSSLS